MDKVEANIGLRSNILRVRKKMCIFEKEFSLLQILPLQMKYFVLILQMKMKGKLQVH